MTAGLRSCPILNERAGKMIDKEALTFNKANWAKYAGEAGLAKMMQDREKAKEPPGQHRIAQLAARDVMKRRPETRTFFVLNLSDGKERFIAPAGYAAHTWHSRLIAASASSGTSISLGSAVGMSNSSNLLTSAPEREPEYFTNSACASPAQAKMNSPVSSMHRCV